MEASNLHACTNEMVSDVDLGTDALNEDDPHVRVRINADPADVERIPDPCPEATHHGNHLENGKVFHIVEMEENAALQLGLQCQHLSSRQ